jgi:hypothetical protein
MIYLLFSINFLSFSQSHLLFEISTFEQTPGKFFRFATMPLVCIKDPGKKEGVQLGPRAMGAAVQAKIRRACRGS